MAANETTMADLELVIAAALDDIDERIIKRCGTHLPNLTLIARHPERPNSIIVVTNEKPGGLEEAVAQAKNAPAVGG